MSTQLLALARHVAEDPLDGNRLRALGLALMQRRDRARAAAAFALAGRAYAQSGQLPMAIVVAKELEPLDGDGAARLVNNLSTDYGKGSRRVDASYRRRPPPPPVPNLPIDDDTTEPARPGFEQAIESAIADARSRLSSASASALPPFPLFHALASRAFSQLVEVAQVREMPAGTIVLDVGTPGDAFYVIAHGSVEIARLNAEGEAAPIGVLRGGAFFGEMALLTDSPRTARATCQTDTILLEVPRRGLDEISAVEPELTTVLADYARERLLANLMLTSELFVRLQPEQREHLARCFATRVFETGQHLTDEGKPAGTLYVVLSGELLVEKRDHDGKWVVVTRLGAGDVVGEISLLTRRPATATVRATHKTVVLALTRDDFNGIVGSFPEVLTHLYQLAVERERDLERLLTEEVVDAEDLLI